MVHLDATLAHEEDPGMKGLKGGALGLISSVVVGVASTAPAYSLAATLGFVVIYINGLQAPIITVLAFVPMLLISYGYKEMNYADPDCGTTFTWGTRAFGPKTGWLGGWGIVAADVLVMASLAQVAGQYVFLLFNANGIGSNASSGWVLLVGIAWIVVMTAICYVGIEVSANFQKALLGIEVTMLLILSIVALVKVGNGTAPPGHLTPSASWFNPFDQLLGLGVHGWLHPDAVHLLGLGHCCLGERGDEGLPPHSGACGGAFDLDPAGDLCAGGRRRPSPTPASARRGWGSRTQLTRATSCRCSAAPSSVVGVRELHDPPVAPDGAELRRRLDADDHPPDGAHDVVHGGLQGDPTAFARVHRRFLTPTVSTVAMGLVSIGLYVGMNELASGNGVILDSVTALSVFIAFYYGLTGFSCAWYWRNSLRESARNLWLRGILPLLGGLILWACIPWLLVHYWKPVNSYTSWTMPLTHWHIGGIFLIMFFTALVGVVLMYVYRAVSPAYFRGEVLNRDTPTRVPDEIGTPVGLFGIEPFEGPDGDGETATGKPDDEPARQT